MRILGRPDSANVQKVVWCCCELGLGYERTDLGGRFGGNQDPEYLALNPNGLVPTLVDGDFVLWESNTIVRYLAGREGRLMPSDVRGRAEVERWMDWQCSVLVPPHVPMFVGLIRTPPEERDWEAINRRRDQSAKVLSILDANLGQREWVAGNEFTVADIALGPFVYRWFELDITREPMSNLKRWYRRLRERPAFNESVAIGLS